MKKTIWVVAIVIILVGVFAFQGRKSDNITLAALVPLSGGNAEQGEWLKRGFDIALPEINKDRKNKIEIVYEDTQGNPKSAVGLYQDLTNRYKIPVVFTWGSGVGVALTPLVNKDKIIQMGLATAVSTYSTPNDFTFRNFPDAALEANYLADAFVNKLKAKEIAVLKINNDYGLSSAKAFVEAFTKKGGKVLTEDTFEAGGSDFRTQLTKIKQLNPKLIYIASYPKEGGLILKQARDLGIKAQFIASVAILGGKDFFNTAGNSAEGLIVVNSILIPDQNDPQSQYFVSEYKTRYNEDVGAQQLYSTRAYDGLKIIAKTIDTCGTDTNCIKDELFKVKDYKGVGGVITFDGNGDTLANFDLQTIKNGKFVELD